jgi:UDP-glucuronate 4-epimerase
LVTGVAGFIGYHCARALLERGEHVAGLDNLSDYYSVRLKQARLDALSRHEGFNFHHVDIADFEALSEATVGIPFRRVIHMAAQPGGRYSVENPLAYVGANLVGHANMLELCRRRDDFEHMVYASSSSVHGASGKLPFSETDRIDAPSSMCGATKGADELMSHAYAHLYRLPLTGLRLFTVYGPWGRPDMAVWCFTEAILAERPIPLFNHGDMRRDFTFIDDVVAGVLAVVDHPRRTGPERVLHHVYNVGNGRSEDIGRLVALLEDVLGRKARTVSLPMPPSGPVETLADIRAIGADYGFRPKTPLEVGVPLFVDWYRAHHADAAPAMQARAG